MGDVVTLTSPRGRLSPVGLLPRVARVRVVGTVKTGFYEFDAGWGYLPLEAARRLLDDEGRTTHVEVRLDDMFAVKDGARSILARLGDGYVTTDWVEMNQSLYSALWIEKVAIGIAIGLIVAVAALNIVATLVLMVMEKHKDIAILVSMGASRGSIMRVFMLQGTIIGAVGTALGGALGAGACWALDRFRVVRVPESVYQIAWVPFRLLPGDAAVVLAAALAHLLRRDPLPGPRGRPPRPRGGPPVRVTWTPSSRRAGSRRATGPRPGRCPCCRASTSTSPPGRWWRSWGRPESASRPSFTSSAPSTGRTAARS